MPITKSAKKSLAVALRRRGENAHRREELKEALRKVSRERLGEVFSTIDRAVAKGIIHTNKAARLKSRLSKKFGSPPNLAKSKPKKTSKSRKSVSRGRASK